MARWAAIGLLCMLGASPAGAEDVDLELVLAVDVSYSMDVEEQRLQRDGYVAALKSPRVASAIAAGPLGRVALTYVEWGGSTVQIVPWTLIDGPQSAARFAARLERQKLRRISFTSISNMLAMARKLTSSNRFQGTRRVIDVSGDGPNNAGAPAPVARNAAVAEGNVVNGLALMLPRPPDAQTIPDIDAYYENCVIGGDGAFVLKITNVSQFAEVIERKLVREISGMAVSAAPALRTDAAFAPAAQTYNCLIGEELQER